MGCPQKPPTHAHYDVECAWACDAGWQREALECQPVPVAPAGSDARVILVFLAMSAYDFASRFLQPT